VTSGLRVANVTGRRSVEVLTAHCVSEHGCVGRHAMAVSPCTPLTTILTHSRHE